MASLRLSFNSLRAPRNFWKKAEVSQLFSSRTDVSQSSGGVETDQERTHEAASANEAPLTYVSPTGWAPPTGKPAPYGVEPDIPFRVRRSVYKQLPVYTDVRNGGNRVLTRISKIDGDIGKMEQLLRQYLQIDNLRMRVDEVTGSIILSGDHRKPVRKFLKELGF